jgi:hypothetical protein
MLEVENVDVNIIQGLEITVTCYENAMECKEHFDITVISKHCVMLSSDF